MAPKLASDTKAGSVGPHPGGAANPPQASAASVLESTCYELWPSCPSCSGMKP